MNTAQAYGAASGGWSAWMQRRRVVVFVVAVVGFSFFLAVQNSQVSHESPLPPPLPPRPPPLVNDPTVRRWPSVGCAELPHATASICGAAAARHLAVGSCDAI